MSTLPVTLLLLLASSVSAHEHHEAETIDTSVPIDTSMWLHVGLQAFVWLALFPFGMVLGMARSRWHIPVQAVGLLLTTAGYVLGHAHGGRQFPATVHIPMANVVIAFLSAQAFLGVYLKLHIHENSIRPYAVRAHGIIGKLYPVIGTIQCVFGYATLGSYCRDGALGQCLAHYIMGCAFVAYGIIMIIILGVGASFIGKRYSQEWFDSWVICLWGVVNTFTEHQGGPWTHKDLQHTMLGVLWWTGGALGIFLSRNNKRSLVPALIIILTGWAMSAHTQALELSTRVHSMFGVTLMLAGAARVFEIAFLLKGQPSSDLMEMAAGHGSVSVFQYLPPYGMIAAGLIFMSATDEELRWADSLEVDHVTYTLFAYSAAFVIFLHACLCLHVYLKSGANLASVREGGVKLENGHAVGNGYEPVHIEAEEFELGGVDDGSEDAQELTMPR